MFLFFFLRGGIYTERREVGCLCFLDIFHLTHSVSWSLVRGADSEARCICGISREGYEFGVRDSLFFGGADGIRWLDAHFSRLMNLGWREDVVA